MRVGVKAACSMVIPEAELQHQGEKKPQPLFVQMVLLFQLMDSLQFLSVLEGKRKRC